MNAARAKRMPAKRRPEPEPERLYQPAAFYDWLNSEDAALSDRWCIAWLAQLRVPASRSMRVTDYESLANLWRTHIVKTKPVKS